MTKKITVVLSQGQSANPAKRRIEEDLVAALLVEPGVEMTVIPHLYDLASDGTGVLCLQGIASDMIVLSWLYPRAAHWTLDRHGIHGQQGTTLLKAADEDEEDELEDDDADARDRESPSDTDDATADNPEPNRVDVRPSHDKVRRKIYCIDLRMHENAEPYLDEIRRIVAEDSVQTVDLLGWIGGSPPPEQLARYLQPTAVDPSLPWERGQGVESSLDGSSTGAPPSQPARVDEETARRWYPVIDYSRCTNCLECLDFCLFGVYGVDRAEAILVEQPDNCRKGCPACSRVCPANAIIFPQHKTPAIAGSNDATNGAFKIDLSKLFGAPDALEVAAQERDVELVAVGRDAVGMTIGMPKRQATSSNKPKDDLDHLMDELDRLDL